MITKIDTRKIEYQSNIRIFMLKNKIEIFFTKKPSILKNKIERKKKG